MLVINDWQGFKKKSMPNFDEMAISGVFWGVIIRFKTCKAVALGYLIYQWSQ